MTESQAMCQFFCAGIGGILIAIALVESKGLTFKDYRDRDLHKRTKVTYIVMLILGIFFVAPGLISMVTKAWMG